MLAHGMRLAGDFDALLAVVLTDRDCRLALTAILARTQSNLFQFAQEVIVRLALLR